MAGFKWPPHIRLQRSISIPHSKTIRAPRIQYGWIDGVEPLELYEPGGYHPIMVGDVLHARYTMVDKLGHGGYSTVWLAHDKTRNHFVALKVGIASSELPCREARILRQLSFNPYATTPSAMRSTIPRVLDDFDIQGPNGTHPCYTTMPAQGDLKTASFSRLFPIQVARALSGSLALAVARVHSQGYVHGDIRLRNVLAELPPKFHELTIQQFRDEYGEPETEEITRTDGKPLSQNVPPKATLPLNLRKPAQEFSTADACGLLLADFGEAFSATKETRFGKNSHMPVPARAPEAFFEPETPLSFPSDVWSLATAIWDIVGMKFLFSESEPEDMVAALQIDVLGEGGFPAEWWKRWSTSNQYFTATQGTDGTVTHIPAQNRDVWPPLHEAFEECIGSYRRKWKGAGEFEKAEARAFLSLMRQMMRFRPEERLDMEGVMKSEWMVKWAMPELRRAQRSSDSLS